MANSNIESKGPAALRSWLDKQKMSVRDLATKIDRTPDLVHAWMNNRSRPVVGDLLVLESLTGLGLREWLTDEERRRFNSFKRRQKKAGEA